MGPVLRRRPAATAPFVFAVVLAAAVAALLHGCGDSTRPEPPSPPPPAARAHRLTIGLEMPDLADPGLPELAAGFDAFLYGHPGAHEDAVERLEAAGLESIRYFNVFHTDPHYPEWGGYYAELARFLKVSDGWIPGVAYPFYSNPQDPDRILDHTRAEVSAGLAKMIGEWADSVGADRVLLDLTFDELADWMIRPGDRWPWPPAEHWIYNQLWRRNMQALVGAVEARGPAMINGSIRLAAGAVLYENQVWNDRRGWSSWEEYVALAVAGDAIPALHVGHHLLQPGEVARGEAMVLAAWLLADRSYLLVEPAGRPLAWAREIQAAGLQRFVPTGPPVEVARGVWQRTGRADGRPFRVEVDLPRRSGRVERMDR